MKATQPFLTSDMAFKDDFHVGCHNELKGLARQILAV